MTYYGTEMIDATKNELKKFIKHESEELYSLTEIPQTDLRKLDDMNVIEMAALANKLQQDYYTALGRESE